MYKPRLRTFAVLVLAAGVLPALAQTPTTPATCTTAPAAPNAFNIERTFVFSNLASGGSSTTPATSGTFSPITPTIGTAIRSALTGGALEARQLFSLNPTTNVITITTFGAQPSSPSPTLPANINFANVISVAQFNVQQVLTSCKPVPSVLYIGTIQSNFPRDPFGDLTGTPAVISVGYTTDNPPKINNIVLVVAGVATTFSSAGVGTITFPAGSTTPPGTTGNAPTIVFSPAATQATAQKQIVLDASKSTSATGGQLTYVWRQVNTNQAAAINNGNTATPLITFNGGKGDYTFEVTVTDSSGNSAKGTTTITYTGL